MITKNEALALTSKREFNCLKPPIVDDTLESKVEALIINKINNGWLFANASPLVKCPNDNYLISRFLQPYGFKIDPENIITWHVR